MTKNSDHSTDIDLVIDIKIITKNNKEYVRKSRSISCHGAVVEHNEDNAQLNIGNTVTLQICSDLGDESPFPVKSEVIAITNHSVEFRFIL